MFDSEAVRGAVHGGAEGRLVVDMPSYSWREFVFRGKHVGEPFLDEVLAMEVVGHGLGRLEVRLGSGFPKSFRTAKAVYRKQCYDLHQTGDVLAISRPGSLYGQGLGTENYPGYSYRNHYVQSDETSAQRSRRVHGALRSPIIQRALEPRGPRDLDRAVHLFIHARRPADFLPASTAPEEGYVVFHMTLYPEEN